MRNYNVDVSLVNGIPVGTGGVPGTEYACLFGSTTGEFNPSVHPRQHRVRGIRVLPVQRDHYLAAAPCRGNCHPCIRRHCHRVPDLPVHHCRAVLVVLLDGRRQRYRDAGYPGGQVLWSQTTPLTAGANWGEWFTPGFELNVSPQASGTLALTYEIGSAGSISGVGFSPRAGHLRVM